MNCQAGQMMHARSQSEQLAVQHVGNPGQRVPIYFAVIGEAEGPFQAFRCQPSLYIMILINICNIIKVYKIVVLYWIVNDNRRHKQEQASQNSSVFVKKWYGTDCDSIHCCT